MGRLLGHGHDFFLLSHRQYLHRPAWLQDHGSHGSYHRLHRTPLQLLHQVRLQSPAPQRAPFPHCSLQLPHLHIAGAFWGKADSFHPDGRSPGTPTAHVLFMCCVLSKLIQVVLLSLYNKRVNFT